MLFSTATELVIDGEAAAFGFIFSSVGCYKGFYTSGGAKGVGLATTQSVVISSISILVADYFLTTLLFICIWLLISTTTNTENIIDLSNFTYDE